MMFPKILPNFCVPGKVSVIIDGQFGSTGKGLVASRIAFDNHYDIAVASLSPNAGHTFYDADMKKHVTKLLPVTGIMDKRCQIYISADAVIDPKILLKEIEEFDIDPSRIAIHPRTAIITEKEKQTEQDPNGVKTIASTQSGTGAARSAKIMRYGILAENYEPLKKYVHKLDLSYYLDNGCSAIVETGQGVDLGINHGLAYPFCTSRDPSQSYVLGELGLHPKYFGKSIAVFRTFPIRVGNIVENGKEVGYSGPFWDDSKEITFSDLNVPDERTTVTKRIRRIATFSMKQYCHTLRLLQPDYILLNFVNYYKSDFERLKIRFPKQVRKPTHMGYGPRPQDITEYDEDALSGILK